MARVIRFEAGGGFVVEAFGLAMEEAKELAARLAEAGNPPGCSWCVGLEEEDKVSSSDEGGKTTGRRMPDILRPTTLR